MSRAVFASSARLPGGWARDVTFAIDEAGSLASVTADSRPAPDAERAAGPVVPGQPNLHSHAFQRAMAGLAERVGRAGAGGKGGSGEGGGANDSFWAWRETMYRFLPHLGPDELEAVAAQLYVEMLEAGYVGVGEFHYLHHDPAGAAYADPAEMALRLIAAARATGIGLTLLPVLYGYGGFGGQPAGEGQRRFLNAPDALLAVVERAIRELAGDPQGRVGLAPHSLRAVTPETLRDGLAGLAALDPRAPVHIHVAEQTKEVEDCLAWSGRRPVRWLLDEAGPDARWCLVHATHMTADETRDLAASGAVAGLCPTTEANLGDGFFPAPDYLAAGGAWGIGSDSHISVDPVEELRWLEYGQRLLLRRRNVLAGASGHLGEDLWLASAAGGARALGRPTGRLAPGCRADLVVLDSESPCLAGREGAALLDAAVFAGNRRPLRDVMVGGRWCVREGRHLAREAVRAGFDAAMARLTA
ncbi:formimidoylglutamate deiminase [Tistlia consotensis]|uniref:Formimidoylglutamate deiminase n=1 Tax=Tistlia consotensis USBA 355 TaxID=560819 RepID=A0A1Y6BKP4_9PROT|nr:formimidoylglutamate deiminase [Tistlia consotensis]SMF16668.1 formimidoylglutamate deiminase [Tistlia consotensis USBA 355]SNR40956.1 formimidoylglutamate deiminase [Tistlia consotensis]